MKEALKNFRNKHHRNSGEDDCFNHWSTDFAKCKVLSPVVSSAVSLVCLPNSCGYDY